MSERVEIGYLCRHGHFQFNGDPEGDSCGSKRIATIYIKADPGVTAVDLAEVADYSLESLHERIEFWRRNA